MTAPPAPGVMLRLVAGRVLALAPTLAGTLTLVFLLLRAVPGDPVDMMLGESAAPAARAELRQRLGLDRPVPAQYVAWMTAALRGDLGTSVRSGRDVSAMVAERAGATARLALAAWLVAVLIGVPLGAAAAGRRGSALDRAASVVGLLAVATPTFWLGPMLVLLFAVELGLLPVAGSESAAHLVLPAATLGIGMSGVVVRMTRASLLGTLGEDWARTARAKGASRRRVLMVHALPNAAAPLLAVLGLQLGAVLSGSVVTESIFAWPGLGRLVVEAIQARDYPVAQGAVLAIAVATVLAGLAADLAQALVDPRSRTGSGR